ncbi:uncharacterized protein At4g18490-like [Chenopodium quinoa]|uniref:uncharacterized protein At4g18490-like n=1 Tax=Chenopodium quinoa TaxID=63459 RepID=UPI000B771B8A|nr:uncharacterized protein At4g18490-like [Chenopodium quinoa]
MAESEKKDSSTGNAKEKMLLLDEDFSKDFLSSWKSGTDDMDFSFEPVSKGKKKAFDFGMDMDFSLDDAFGKMPSFKMDLPDIDFSNSPNKSKKSKEKSEEDSAKGNRSDKHDKFNFSFDFDGMNISDGEKDPGDGGCFGSAKFPSDTINTSAASVQTTNDGGRTELSVSEDIREGSTHTSAINRSYGSSKNNGNTLDDHPSSCTKELIQSDSVIEKSERNAAAQTPPRDHDDPVNGKNMKEVSVNTVQHNGKANGGLPSLECEKMNNNVKISGDMDFSLDDAFGKMSSFKMDMPDVDFPKSTKLVEISEVVSAKGKHQDKHDKFTYTFDSDGMNTSDGKNEHGHGGSLGSAKLPSDAVNTSETSDTKAMSSIARSSAEMLKPVSKASSTTYDSGPTSAKTTLLKIKVPRAINSRFLAVQATNEGGRTEFSASEGNQEGTTHTDAVNRSVSVSCSYGSSKHIVKELNDRPSSCTKELIQSDSVTEKSEKDAAAHTPPRDHDDIVNGEERNEASVDTVTQNGKAVNDGLPSLECEKMTSNVKSSGFKIPLSTPPEQGTKNGNQRQGNLKDKISSIALTQKLNIGQGNKLTSQRIDKKTFALPSLKVTRRTTTDKHPAAPIMLSNVKSLGIVEKSTRPQQAMVKTVSPTISGKQTPTPSLKRKPSEAADMGPPKLYTPKRFSPNESRMSKVAVREPGDGVQTQVNSVVGSTKNVSQENKTPNFHFDQEANMAALQFSLMVENDANVEKAEACAKELDNICNMLKKKHEEAKELLVRALVNNNNLLMLNHPIYEEKISAVQRLASKLMSKELEVEA